MRLYCINFNFCRDHIGLTKEKENGVVEKNTFAKKWEITKTKWMLRELLIIRLLKWQLIKRERQKLMLNINMFGILAEINLHSEKLNSLKVSINN